MTKKYYLWILGCQMNYADAERIVSVLNELGYIKTDEEQQADLIITVACSVRQSAIDRVYGKAKIWNKIRKKKRLTTILTGCVLEIDKIKMAKIFDHIFDISDLTKLSELLDGKKLTRNIPDGRYLNIEPKHQNHFSAFVPISTGCENFCTYCVVPYARGPETSRSSKKIIDECQKLINNGFKEIILLGQNVNSYGHDLSDGLNFPGLLQKIAKLEGDFWLRFVTSHPKDMSDELIEVIAKNGKICHYIHLPVQAGDDEILKKMNRQYAKKHYLNLIEKIRNQIPDVFISTDIIVGFPGETKKQFQNTAKLMKQAKFNMAYIAQYSPRSGTVAYQLNDDVPKKEKLKRKEALEKILKKTALKQNKLMLGKEVEVLVENTKNNYLIGKSKTYQTVKIKINPIGKTPNHIGQFVITKITKAKSFGLEGILVKSNQI